MNLPPLDIRPLRHSGDQLTDFMQELDGAAMGVHSQHPSTFAELVKKAIQEHDLDGMIVAVRFGVDPGMVSQWAEGQLTPPPEARAIVLKWMKDRLQRELDQTTTRELVAG